MVSEKTVKYGDYELLVEEVEGLRVIRTDTFLQGAWVNGTRFIVLRGRKGGTLRIDCSQFFPNRDQIDRHFNGALEPIWYFVGSRLVAVLLGKLAQGETVNIGGIELSANGVWIAGSWKVLWWRAKPQLVPWVDLRISSQDGSLLLQSRGNLRLRSELSFNDTENSMVLDAAIRHLLRDDNWKTYQVSTTLNPSSPQCAA